MLQIDFTRPGLFVQWRSSIESFLLGDFCSCSRPCSDSVSKMDSHNGLCSTPGLAVLLSQSIPLALKSPPSTTVTLGFQAGYVLQAGFQPTDCFFVVFLNLHLTRL